MDAYFLFRKSFNNKIFEIVSYSNNHHSSMIKEFSDLKTLFTSEGVLKRGVVNYSKVSMLTVEIRLMGRLHEFLLCTSWSFTSFAQFHVSYSSSAGSLLVSFSMGNISWNTPWPCSLARLYLDLVFINIGRLPSNCQCWFWLICFFWQLTILKYLNVCLYILHISYVWCLRFRCDKTSRTMTNYQDRAEIPVMDREIATHHINVLNIFISSILSQVTRCWGRL